MATFVNIMGSEVVGEEERIEFATVEQFRQVDPIVKPVLCFGLVNWILPLSWAYVADAIHVKGIQQESLRGLSVGTNWNSIIHLALILVLGS